MRKDLSSLRKMLSSVKKQSIGLSRLTDAGRRGILTKAAANIRKNAAGILRANAKDIAAARSGGRNAAFIDRLALDRGRIEVMARQVTDVAKLKSPLGRVLEKRTRPNGLVIRKVSVPIGVIFIIYESRPNVTSDTAALCVKSGNAVVLRGGSDSLNSNSAIYRAFRAALPAGLKEAVMFIKNTDRSLVRTLLGMNEYIDAVIPRGGEGLVKSVVENSRIPVIYHGKGVCSLYVRKDADFKMAVKIALNAKVQRPAVCNAIENILADRAGSKKFLPLLAEEFERAGVEMRGCPETVRIIPGIKKARKADWDTEYLDKIIAIKVVSGDTEAADFINEHGSRHSDAIITASRVAAERFFSSVDSACVYHNASTRFTDGGEFGMGAEMGISNQKLHARGPVGLNELTTYKYVISGRGQIRE